jgi:hypothetical protein
MYLRSTLTLCPTYTSVSQLLSSLQIFYTTISPRYLTHTTCPANVILANSITRTSHIPYIGIQLSEQFTGSVMRIDITFKL